MKCLSIRQPWAELIVRGVKDVENRGWPTEHRGALLIHAGRTWDRSDFDMGYLAPDALGDDGGLAPEDCVFGAILGVVELVDCTLEQASPWHLGDCCGWYLANPRRFETPVPYKGQLRLFDVPEHLLPLPARADGERPGRATPCRWMTVSASR